GDIEFKNVYFGYKAYNPVLKDVSFSIKQGEMIGRVGHSGVGKSTLINLVMRLYDATSGQVLIDGTDVRDISQNSLRSQVGVVLQETYLFSGTVLDNIRYA
ncbi:ATP-binding cassette domain-containing protein, partial [[Eubacterium] siraeum]|nr:ATP-binding cassette domain-containing protein [[Eubacterium] siraeum]